MLWAYASTAALNGSIFVPVQEDRTQMLDQLAALDKHVKEGAEELSKYADNDPEKLDAMSTLHCSRGAHAPLLCLS